MLDLLNVFTQIAVFLGSLHVEAPDQSVALFEPLHFTFVEQGAALGALTPGHPGTEKLAVIIRMEKHILLLQLQVKMREFILRRVLQMKAARVGAHLTPGRIRLAHKVLVQRGNHGRGVL